MNSSEPDSGGSRANAIGEMPPAIICRALTKDFGAGEMLVQALRGIDLEIPAGEMTLVVGPSGCGKTTLISIIASLLEPSGGDISVLGTDLTRLTPAEKAAFRRRQIGFVFQQYNLLPALTAVENAAVPLLIGGWRRSAAMARARELIETVGLRERADAPPSQLSGGQQQRVAIARALIHNPNLLVCDEPTSALDAQLGHSTLELIRAVAVRPGRAVLVVTHDRRIFGFANRIIRMNDGRIDGIEVTEMRSESQAEPGQL